MSFPLQGYDTIYGKPLIANHIFSEMKSVSPDLKLNQISGLASSYLAPENNNKLIYPCGDVIARFTLEK